MMVDYTSKSKQLWLVIILVLAAILRLAQLDKLPPSLYSDETNQGYNAYSLLLTGRDEHGVWLPVSLRSFGDWKPPLSTYLMIAPIAVWGLSAFPVRLPSAILGIVSVYLTYSLVRRLIPGSQTVKIALVASLFIAISPWHLQQSRSAMLVMVALVTMQAGTVAFFIGLHKPRYLLLATTWFTLSIYAYYGARLVTPIWLFVLVIIFLRRLQNPGKKLLVNVILALLLLTPLIWAFVKEPNVILGRAKTVSIFYDRGVELKLWEFAAEEGPTAPRMLTRFFHNKVYLYTREVAMRFFSHLDGSFLFVQGDRATPFQIPNMGVMYYIDWIFLIVGSYLLVRKAEPSCFLLALWLSIAIFPAALTFLTPSHNRSFSAVFPLVVVVAYGLVNAFRGQSVKNLNSAVAGKLLPIFPAAIFSIFYCFSMTYYLIQYWRVLPTSHANWWHFGLKEIVHLSNDAGQKNKTVVFLPKTNIAYIYFLFYNRYDPHKFMTKAIHDYMPDESGFEHVRQFDRFVSLRRGGWEDALKYRGQALIVGQPGEIPETFVDKRIYYPDGEEAFEISGSRSQ